MCPDPPRLPNTEQTIEILGEFQRPNTSNIWPPTSFVTYQCDDDYPILVPEYFQGASCTVDNGWLALNYGEWGTKNLGWGGDWGKCITGNSFTSYEQIIFFLHFLKLLSLYN